MVLSKKHGICLGYREDLRYNGLDYQSIVVTNLDSTYSGGIGFLEEYLRMNVLNKDNRR